MTTLWPHEFRERMLIFEGRRKPRPGETPVSFKLRVNSGCFHREHSPWAYEEIDRNLKSLGVPGTAIAVEEHESGPEILALVALSATGLTLAAAVVNLIAAIIKARSEGIKKGDHASAPLHLIVRCVHEEDGFRDEQVLTVGHTDAIDKAELQKQLDRALRKLLTEGEPSNPNTAASKSPAQKKKAKKPPQRKKKK